MTFLNLKKFLHLFQNPGHRIKALIYEFQIWASFGFFPMIIWVHDLIYPSRILSTHFNFVFLTNFFFQRSKSVIY
jgi:hypothetical protein